MSAYVLLSSPWYHCQVLLDLFRFSNTYALRPGVAALFAGGPPPSAHVGANPSRHHTPPTTNEPSATARYENGGTANATSGGVFSNVVDIGSGNGGGGVNSSRQEKQGPCSSSSSPSSSFCVDGGDAQGEWLEETIAYVACRRHHLRSITLEHHEGAPPSPSSPTRRASSSSSFSVPFHERTKSPIKGRYATPMVVPWGPSLLDAVNFADLNGAHSNYYAATTAAALSGGSISFSSAPSPAAAAASPLNNPSDAWYNGDSNSHSNVDSHGNGRSYSSAGTVTVEAGSAAAATTSSEAARGVNAARAGVSLSLGLLGNSSSTEGRSRVMITTSGPSSFDRWNRSRGLLFDPTRDISPAAAAARHNSSGGRSSSSSTSSHPSPNRVLSSTPPNRPPSVLRTTPWGSLERNRNSGFLTSKGSNDLQSIAPPSPLRRARTVESSQPTLRGGNIAASSLGAVSVTATGASIVSSTSASGGAIHEQAPARTGARTTWMSAPETVTTTTTLSQDGTAATTVFAPHATTSDHQTSSLAPEKLDSRSSPLNAKTAVPPVQDEQQHLTPRELLRFYLRFGDGSTVRAFILYTLR